MQVKKQQLELDMEQRTGSSVSDFHPDTKWAVVDTFFRFACSVTLWGGRDAANK